MILLHENNTDPTPKIATIGFFDGVHGGHRYLLGQMQREGATRGLSTMAVTFDNHPRIYFNPECGLQLLSLPAEKQVLLDSTGVDYCLMLHFNANVARLTSYQFMQLLTENYGVRCLMTGYDHHFGSDRLSTFDDYVRYGKELGIEVIQCNGFSEENIMVSSSKIRKALDACNIRLANNLLGHRYAISGHVVEGQKIGRKIGFPTANLVIDPLKLYPANGVYAVKVNTGTAHHDGMLNIGRRPTVDGRDTTIEVHLIDFQSDLYGHTLELEFVDFIRGEEKFSSLDSLAQQLEKDLIHTKTVLKTAL